MSFVESSVLQVVEAQSDRVLETYRIDGGLIREHANGERRISQGGYGDRQVFELVQNGADELRGDPGGEICVVLTATHLYCANQGEPITPDGVDTILRMSSSRKRGGQIGRFGVGVKSVLSVSDSPEFFGSTGSFGFDKEWSARRIRAVRPDVEEIPVLRMARPLDQVRAAKQDTVLAELLKWATTVVRLPLHPDKVGVLARDIQRFPSEFCLFSPHVGTVTLEDRRADRAMKRQIFQRVSGDAHSIQEERSSGAAATTVWRVFTRTHKPSKEALRSAGELHDRPEVDISWAVPDRAGREGRLGEFWAYFPTRYKTTLRGIVNAPWKTSEDRQNLYGANSFNDEMIRAVADLVVDAFPVLSKEDDPAAYLDVTPARGREEPQWASEDLVEAIWRATVIKPSVPDQAGEFHKPGEIRLHPADLSPKWLEWWRQYPNRPVGWVEHSAERTKQRRASVERIYTAARVPAASTREWLEALVVDGSPEASAAAVRIAADMVQGGHGSADQVLKAHIVLTESNGMSAPDAGQVFCRISGDDLPDTLTYVDPRLVDEFGVRAALEVLGVHDAHAAGRFTAVVDQGFHGYDHDRWTAFWGLMRQIGPAVALDILRSRAVDLGTQIKVRTVSGKFRQMNRCLLPGLVVPGDGSRDADVAVDIRFHDADRLVLRELGLTDIPRRAVNPSTEKWFPEYVEAQWKSYLRTLDVGEPRPTLKAVRLSGADVAGPLDLLTELSAEGCAGFIREMPDEGLVPAWALQAGRSTVHHQVISPLIWMARKYGQVSTTKGLRRPGQAVSRALKEYGDLFPVADVTADLAHVLDIPDSLKKVSSSLWNSLLAAVDSSEEDTFPGRVYELLFKYDIDIEVGNTRCKVGDGWSSNFADDEIAVTAVRSDYEELVRERIPVVLVPDVVTAERMIEGWGMRAPADVIERQIRYVEQGETRLLIEEFPPLRQLRGKVDGWSLVRCSELEEIVQTPHGARNESRKYAVEDKRVLVLGPCDDLDTLLAVDQALRLELGEPGCRSVLDRRRQQQSNERLAQVRKAPTANEKIVELVGAEQLRRKLPKGLIESEKAETGQEPDGIRLAQLAIDAHGDSVLRHHARDIEARFPEVASSFRGDNASRQLVNDLQLPETYAGTKVSQTRDALEIVEGPTEFPGLHEYQERLAARMFDLLDSPSPQRAMLCLPTGAGKTRVVAEAVIRFIKARGLGGRPVLWIAQTDELCEQAVESWKFVWSKVGPAERLTISRFWASNDAVAVRDSAHLVVASDAQLDARLASVNHAWLREAALVVVDEAHGSITSRYTEIMRLLGITHRTLERPLIGLTATPFRGFNQSETRRLVERYGANRLDQNIFDEDPYVALQKLGMLATVEHRELAGATMQLTDEELEAVAAKPFQRNLPSAAEQRLGEDVSRNQMLVSEISRLERSWPVLLFATSVNHAKLMAALLNRSGITARAIDSATPAAERRTIIDDYRCRNIQVITNYGVLAQGFDAPATRAVVVARPTYSPNVYTQMIGRGLRGPKNGGGETCLILDVQDNITNYRRALTFNGFEHLWERGEH